MYELMGQARPASGRAAHVVELEAPDAETLMVDWLSELLYRMEVDDETYYVVNVTSASHERLKAVLVGGRNGAVRKPIKAVTYHDLEVRLESGACQATVVFDV
jgi:SHS2 domain-containing protein